MNAEQLLVSTSPIGTNLNVTNDDIVAFMVSNTETKVRNQITAISTLINELHDKITESEKIQTQELIALGKKKKSDLEVDFGSCLSFMKNAGLIKPTIVVAANISNNKLQFTINIVSGGKSVFTSTVDELLPKALSGYGKARSNWQEEIEKLTSESLSLKRFLSTEMQSLERQARGKLAEVTMRQAGGQWDDLLTKMNLSLPSNVAKLLPDNV